MERNMAVRRGRTRDKMATGGKLAAENHGRSIRLRSALAPDRIPRARASRLDNGTEIANATSLRVGKFARLVPIADRDDDDNESRNRDATHQVSISLTVRKHSPSRGPARLAMSPAYLALRFFRDAFRVNRARLRAT